MYRFTQIKFKHLKDYLHTFQLSINRHGVKQKNNLESTLMKEDSFVARGQHSKDISEFKILVGMHPPSSMSFIEIKRKTTQV